ncbi:MAG: TonB-dependent receptor [Lewinellaceae bacterium]|nr:TonB-dependent receptor [Phaeodactylibacter sp.]MCB9036368.1 TonB-dependent receptor [Lewinellaceae bacterium]
MNSSKAILFALLLGLSNSLSAQPNGSVKGRITDAGTGAAIEYASITLYSAQDSSLADGMVTDAEGRFEFSRLARPEVYLVARFLGYETYSSETFLVNGQTDLGTIGLAVAGQALEEVEVTGKEITARHKVSKQVYDAGQFGSARGGTAADVLRSLPSVAVDQLGTITVRGAAGFLLLINGKPVQAQPEVVLNQIAANAIEDIEVITAPSAKYDPDGHAGIINVITRRGAADGIFLSANGLWGLPSAKTYNNAERSLRYGADVTVNYKKGKWDFSAGADFRRNDRAGGRRGYVNTYEDDILTEFPSQGERSYDEENYSGRASVVYTPNARQSVSASFYAGKRTKTRTADILYRQRRTRISTEQFLGTETYYDLFEQTGSGFFGGALVDSLTYFNQNNRVRRGDFLIAGLDYTYTFADKSTLKASNLFERTVLGGPTRNNNLAWPNLKDTLQRQTMDNDNPLNGLRLQLGYARKLGAFDWESGYQYRFLKHPGDFSYLDRNFQEGIWEINPLFTNSMELRRRIHALYTQVSGQWNKLEFIAGLRAETFSRDVEIARPDTLFELSRFNLFPSANLLYDMGNGLSAKAGYSRRIERATTVKVTPFPEREHSEVLEQGDAELLPEYIDLVEVGLIKEWGDHSAFATAYYQNITDVVNRSNTVFNDTILNRIYTNAGSATAYGLETGATFYPAKWWQCYLGGNVYNYRIKGRLFGEKINRANTVYSIGFNSKFTFSPGMELQLNFNYLSEKVTAQGKDSRFFTPNLAFRKYLLGKKLALAFQWLNIDMGLLNSNESFKSTWSDDFFLKTAYIIEADVFLLSVSYQINQPSKKMKFIRSEFGAEEF